MDPTAILRTLEDRGVKVVAAGDRLRLAPPEAVSPDLLNLVRQHKVALLAALRGERGAGAREHEPVPWDSPSVQAEREALLARAIAAQRAAEAGLGEGPMPREVVEAWLGIVRGFDEGHAARDLEAMRRVVERAEGMSKVRA